MIDYTINHHIQKFILNVLYRQKNARFRELRKPNVDTNLFAYHLKLLLKKNFVKKIPEGYTLGEEGLYYIDRISEVDMNIRMQPKIITMLVMQNTNGEILLQKRTKQPFIDVWTLPHGKLHIEDDSINAAIKREAFEKIQISNIEPTHVGDCYVCVKSGDKKIASTFVHVFRCVYDDIIQNDEQILVHPRKLSNYKLAPAIEKIIARSFFDDPFFFEEYIEELY